MPILLSEHLGVSAGQLDALGVFNAVIDLDSRLHVDPHLLADSEAPEMQEARDQVTKHFEDIIALLDASSSTDGPLWEEAKRRLQSKELEGVSLGYSMSGSSGSGVGPHLAKALAHRAFYIIKAGEKNPRILELVGLFTEDYGPDRISDVVLRVARKSFATYTARIAAVLGVMTTPVIIESEVFELPVQVRKGKASPLLCVPKDILRDLPVALSYSEIAEVAQYNAAVRSKINELFASVAKGKRPAKRELWDRVKHDPSLVKALVQAYLKAHGLPYDFLEDRAAEYGRFLEARAVASDHPLILSRPSEGWTDVTAFQATLNICEHFKRLVEVNGLWDSFWINKMPPKTIAERAIQRIFFGIALTYCREGNPDLDISPETNAGPGPVDFKFSHGAKIKVTVEMKKSTHAKLLHGYQTQLQRYNSAEGTDQSIFLMVRVSDDAKRINDVLQASHAAIDRGERAPEVVIVDARTQLSASKA